MILVTGATGSIGGSTAIRLSDRGLAIRMFGSDAGRMPRLPNAELALGSYENAASLDAAMRGIDCAFVVSAGGEPVKRARLHMNAMDAAVRAGVRHVVYLSFQGASPASRFPYAVDHALTESHLRTSGLAFTILRDSLYLDNLPHLFDEAGVVRGPAGDGRTAWVARSDVADVAAAVLADPAAFAGGTFDVTGPEAIGYAEVAATLSELTGRTLRYENETLEEARRSRAALGAPAWQVETWIGSYLAAGAGELATASDTVERIAGHPPLDLRAWAAASPPLLRPLVRAADCIPKDKFDVAAVERARALWPDGLGEIVPDLLACLKDVNWPVAGPASDLLRQPVESGAADAHLRTILASNDDVWKYWIVSTLLPGTGGAVERLRANLERIARHPTAGEREEEVDDAARALLASRTAVQEAG